ncbi:hypothetical protein R6Q57_010864 [Mikania cordata]
MAFQIFCVAFPSEIDFYKIRNQSESYYDQLISIILKKIIIFQMAFGKEVSNSTSRDTQQHTDDHNFGSDDDIVEITNIRSEKPESTQKEAVTETQGKQKDDKPLMGEVDFVGYGNSKNAGGSKVWICKHCKQKFTSSYTRIHVHFFGAPVGKKAEIKRCF